MHPEPRMQLKETMHKLKNRCLELCMVYRNSMYMFMVKQFLWKQTTNLWEASLKNLYSNTRATYMYTQMLKILHNSHLGQEKCIQRVKSTLIWPGIITQLKDTIKQCIVCYHYRNAQQKEPMIPDGRKLQQTLCTLKMHDT